MPCPDCHHREAIIAQLKAALEERDLQLSDVNAKLAKQKLHSKAKFAQLKHQILENVAEKEGADSQKIVENLMTRLDETDNQLSMCRDELDGLKATLSQKDAELNGQKEKIESLEATVRHLEENPARTRGESRSARGHRHADVTSEKETDDEELRDRVSQMYAQMVYKDSKIVDLNEVILHRDQKILDLQESCRERDEVIWAKTKAIQVFQEKLNFYANREFRDIATETTAISHDDAESDAAGPGRAVAFYRVDQALRGDDDESSITTEAKVDTSLVEKFSELADVIRSSSNGISAPSLNVRLSEMVQQVEAVQNRLVVLEADRLQQKQKDQPKKKREKKVTFDFTVEQERAQELAAVTEKLHQFEQACSDLREENDDLRITIGDLERQLSSNADQNVDLEKYTETENQLTQSLETIEALKIELSDKEDEVRTLKRQVESIYAPRIQELEHQIEQWRNTVSDKETEQRDAIDAVENQLYAAQLENVKLIQQREMILSDVDDLREAIETSQQLINGLENDLQLSNNELEDVRSALENQRRDFTERIAVLERDVSNQKLGVKAYETKLRSVEREKERLSDLLDAQKQEWISLKTEGKEEVTGFRLKAKAYEAKFRIFQDDNQRLENLVMELKLIVDTVQNEKAELTRDYDRKLTEFEHEAKENLVLIERAMAEQKVEIETLKAELSSEARLKTKAYEAKWRSIGRENERLTEAVAEMTKSIELRELEKQQLSDELTRLKEKIKENSESQQRDEGVVSELRDVLEKAEQREEDLKSNLEKIRSTMDSKTIEYTALMDELTEAQSSIRSLRSQLESSKTSLDQSKDQVRLLNDEKQDLETDLHQRRDSEVNLKRRINELERANGQLVEESVSLRNRCQVADGEEQKLFDLTSSYELLKQDHAKLKEKMEFLEAASSNQSNQLAAELQYWKNGFGKLEMENGELKQELLLFRQREADLIEDKKMMENRFVDLEKRFTDLSKEFTNQKSLLQVVSEENGKLKSDYESAVEIFNEAHSLLEKTNMENGSREAILKNEISGLRAMVQSLGEEKEALWNDYSHYKANIADGLSNLQMEKRTLNEQIIRLQAEKNELGEQLDRARENILSSDQWVAAIQSERDAAVVKANNFEHQISVLQDRLAGSVDRQKSSPQDRSMEVDALKMEIDRLMDELGRVKIQYQDTLRTADDLQNRYQETQAPLINEIGRLNEEIANLMSGLSEKDQEIVSLVKEKEALLLDSENLRLDRSKLENELRQLADELSEVKSISQSSNNSQQQESDDVYQHLVSSYGELKNRNQSLINNLQELKSDKERLSETLKDLEHDREKLGEERHSLCAEIVALNEKLSNADLLTEELKQEIENLVEENESLKTSSKATTEAHDDDQSSKDSEIELVAQLEKQNRDVQENYQQLVLYYTELQSAYATVYQQYQHLQEKPSMLDVATEVDRFSADKSFVDVAINTEETANSQVGGADSPGRGNTPDQSRSDLIKMKAKLRKMEKTMQALEAKNRYLQEEKTAFEAKLAEMEMQSALIMAAQNDRLHEPRVIVEDDVHQTKLNPVSAVPESFNVFDGQEEKKENQVSVLVSKPGQDVETERKIAIAMAEAHGLQQHVSVLVDQVNGYKAKNDELQERLGKAETERSNFKKRLDEANETMGFLNEELNGVKHLCQTMDSEKQELQRRVTDLAAQETVLKKSLGERTSAFASMQSAASESESAMKIEIEELATVNGSLKEELANAVLERDRGHEKVRRLLASNDELETASHDMADRIRSLEQRCSELELLPAVQEENVQLKTRMQDLVSMLKNWETQVATLESRIHNLAKENAELVREKKEAIEKFDVANSTLEKLQEESSRSNEDVTFMRSMLEELEYKNRQLQDEMDELSAKCRQFESLQDLVAYHKDLEQRFHEETEKCDVIEKKLFAANSELEILRANETAALEKISVLERECDGLRIEIQRVAASKKGETVSTSTDLAMNDLELLQQESESEIRRLAVENERLTETVRNWEGRMNDLQNRYKENQDLNTVVEELKSENRGLVEENRRVSEAYDQVEATKKELEIRLDESKNEVNRSNKRQEILERDVESLTASLETLDSELLAARDNLEKSTKRILELEGQTEQLREEILLKTSSGTAVEAAQRTIEELTVAITASKEETEKAKTDSDTIRSLYEQLYQAYGQLEGANQGILEQLQASKLELEQKDAVATDLRRDLDEMKLSVEKANNDVRAAEEEKEKISKESTKSLQAVEEHLRDLESMKNYCSQVEAKSADLTAQLETKLAAVRESEINNQRLISELATKEKMLDEATVRSDRLDYELGSKQSELDRMNILLQSTMDRSSQLTETFTRMGVDATNPDNVYRYLENLTQERDSFNRQRSELVSKVEAVQVRASNFDREKERSEILGSENASLKKHIETLEQKVAGLSSEYENQIKDLRHRVESASLIATESWQHYLHDVLKQLNVAAVNDFEGNLKRLGSTALEMESAKISLDQDSRLWKSKLEKAEADGRQAKEQWKKLESGLESWREKYRNLENDISLKNEKVLELENSVKPLKDKCASLESECQQWRASSNQIEDLQRRFLSVEKLANEKIAECADLQSQLLRAQGLGEENQEIYQQLENANSTVADFERQLLIVQNENAILKQKTEQQTADNSIFQKRIEESDSAAAILAKRIDDVVSEKDGLAKRLEDRNSEFGALEQQLEIQRVENVNTCQQLDIQNHENADLRNDVENQKSALDAIRKDLENISGENTSLKTQLIELDDLKSYADRLSESLNQKDFECVQLRENLNQAAEERHRYQTEYESRQRQSESEMVHYAGAKDVEYRQEIARLQNEFAVENARISEEMNKAIRERQEAIQWLEQERPKYVSAIRNLGETKELLTQRQRQLESAYLKLAELDVLKEQLREADLQHERTKMEKKEFASQCDRLRQENEAILRQLSAERNELENLKIHQSYRLEEGLQKSPSMDEPEDRDSADSNRHALVAVQAENKELREELKASETKNAYLLARFREMEYQQQNWSSHSPHPEQMLDVESGSEHGDTISLMPVGTSSSRRGDDRSLQLRRETLGLSGERSGFLKSAQLWLRSKIRKYPYLSRRRPNILKLLVIAYLLMMHIFVFICWFR